MLLEKLTYYQVNANGRIAQILLLFNECGSHYWHCSPIHGRALKTEVDISKEERSEAQYNYTSQLLLT
jgi:hypothetical protein